MLNEQGPDDAGAKPAAENVESAADSLLLSQVYEELRKLAVVRLAHEQPGQTLQPTALFTKHGSGSMQGMSTRAIETRVAESGTFFCGCRGIHASHSGGSCSPKTRTESWGRLEEG